MNLYDEIDYPNTAPPAVSAGRKAPPSPSPARPTNDAREQWILDNMPPMTHAQKINCDMIRDGWRSVTPAIAFDVIAELVEDDPQIDAETADQFANTIGRIAHSKGRNHE